MACTISLVFSAVCPWLSVASCDNLIACKQLWQVQTLGDGKSEGSSYLAGFTRLFKLTTAYADAETIVVKQQLE